MSVLRRYACGGIRVSPWGLRYSILGNSRAVYRIDGYCSDCGCSHGGNLGNAMQMRSAAVDSRGGVVGY